MQVSQALGTKQPDSDSGFNTCLCRNFTHGKGQYAYLNALCFLKQAQTTVARETVACAERTALELASIQSASNVLSG